MRSAPIDWVPLARFLPEILIRKIYWRFYCVSNCLFGRTAHGPCHAIRCWDTQNEHISRTHSCTFADGNLWIGRQRSVQKLAFTCAQQAHTNGTKNADKPIFPFLSILLCRIYEFSNIFITEQPMISRICSRSPFDCFIWCAANICMGVGIC